jgi:hypothetical protein
MMVAAGTAATGAGVAVGTASDVIDCESYSKDQGEVSVVCSADRIRSNFAKPSSLLALVNNEDTAGEVKYESACYSVELVMLR